MLPMAIQQILMTITLAGESALQCVAVCCRVLQCVAECVGLLQCVAVCWSVLQCVISGDSANSRDCYPPRPECVAVCCIVLQCVAVCCSALPRATQQIIGTVTLAGESASQCVAVCCSVLQFVNSGNVTKSRDCYPRR
jgi:hypothetical protein